MGSDVGVGLPGPIGEGLAVLEEGLAAPGPGDSEGNRARPTHKGVDEGIARVCGFAREYAGEHLAELLVQQLGDSERHCTGLMPAAVSR
jgi:hypothetical protein